ncbi:hypothetical protein ACFVR1_08435 [Psychrobacillus sp. NPDC058041]|uniref:hypothetical protein n=1 Tax=Psychrobacillus sp. NPDC058041 TaxID=3346310 RepID=UPI0036D9628D
MKNKTVSFFIIFILFLTGCSEQENKNNLTRVDVYKVTADGKYDGELIISDKSTVDILNQVFEQIVWEQNVKAEMSRREDIKAILFMEVEKDMPERLVGYFIWFERNGTATIINYDDSSFGKLDEKNANILKSKFNFE